MTPLRRFPYPRGGHRPWNGDDFGHQFCFQRRRWIEPQGLSLASGERPISTTGCLLDSIRRANLPHTARRCLVIRHADCMHFYRRAERLRSASQRGPEPDWVRTNTTPVGSRARPIVWVTDMQLAVPKRKRGRSEPRRRKRGRRTGSATLLLCVNVPAAPQTRPPSHEWTSRGAPLSRKSLARSLARAPNPRVCERLPHLVS